MNMRYKFIVIVEGKISLKTNDYSEAITHCVNNHGSIYRFGS
jgi:hypothetical protein